MSTDYGQPLAFGINLDPAADGLAATVDLARAADAAGLDLLAIMDHPYESSQLDALLLGGLVLSRTESIAVFTDVAHLQLRPAPMLAKAAASLALQSGDRFRLGVGGGAFPDRVSGMGTPGRSPAQIVAYTEEALHVLLSALRGGAVHHDGRELQIPGYVAGPVPAQPVPLWLGALRPRMLGVAGRASEGWICPINTVMPAEQAAGLQPLIDTAARSAGRRPADIRRIYNVSGGIGTARGNRGLFGSVDHWIQTLSAWTTELGFDTYVFWPAASPREQLEIFARDVVPAVRECVQAARQGARR
jgi:alkanesulfonate monooxygenase SsuD/methylene tetrahydromethanopterin reductase-like flavin-dependent oxidoreductase (luciferase family)